VTRPRGQFVRELSKLDTGGAERFREWAASLKAKEAAKEAKNKALSKQPAFGQVLS